jgi:hypothetical protein
LKLPALKTFIEGIDTKQFNILPVYGYPFQEKFNRPEDDEHVFPQNILQVITAARYAQLNGNSELQKPLIIAVFYDYTEEATRLLQLVQQDQWGEYDLMKGATHAKNAIKTLGLRGSNVFSIVSLSDPEASKKIQALLPGQILLISMGPLPKIVFDGIYTHTATNVLPQMREGESSLSALLQTGMPHFRCISYYNDEYNDSAWELGFELVHDDAMKNRLISFYGKNGFCAKNGWESDPLIYKKVGDLMIEAKNPSSSFSQYFADLKSDTMKPQNDRIYRGLEEALKVFGKEG